MTTLRRPSRAELQVAVLDCAALGAACLLSYWLVTRGEPRVHPVHGPADQIGGLWAMISTIFVLRDSYQQSMAAAVSRMAATSVSFLLCFIYLIFLPFHAWALAVLIGASALAVILLGRPADAVSAAISSAVVLVAARLNPVHPWQQPILRFIDTLVGIAVGLATAWLLLRVVRPRLPPGQSQDRGGAAAAE